MSDEHDDDACVDAWRASLGEDVVAAALIRAFERAFRAVWRRAQLTLGDVTLVAIGDRVLHDAAEQHPILRDVRIESDGISCDELQRRAASLEMPELERAVRSVLGQFLAVLGRLTAGVLTPPLHAALLDDRDEETAS
jgi:hypothetical protein